MYKGFLSFVHFNASIEIKIASSDNLLLFIQLNVRFIIKTHYFLLCRSHKKLCVGIGVTIEKAAPSCLPEAVQLWQVCYWLLPLRASKKGRNRQRRRAREGEHVLLVTGGHCSAESSPGKSSHWRVCNGWAVISPGNRVHLTHTQRYHQPRGIKRENQAAVQEEKRDWSPRTFLPGLFFPGVVFSITGTCRRKASVQGQNNSLWIWAKKTPEVQTSTWREAYSDMEESLAG